MLVSQGREGNMTWLKRQLWEAQDKIVHLREAQRASKELNMKHLREREAVGEKVRADLVNAQKRHD